MHGLHGLRSCLDPVLSAIEGHEHLLSDLETTVLVLLAHGAPVSVSLGEDAAGTPAASQSRKVATVESHVGARAPGTMRSSAAASNEGVSPSVGKWWMPVECSDEMHGDWRVLADACGCNSWPLVAAVLACIPPESIPQQVRPSVASLMLQAFCTCVCHGSFECGSFSDTVRLTC